MYQIKILIMSLLMVFMVACSNDKSEKNEQVVELKEKLTSIKAIYSNSYAFAAIKKDGTVVTWGRVFSGGDSSAKTDELYSIKSIVGSRRAFAALRDDGTVITWGSIFSGGDSSAKTDELYSIKSIVGSRNAFAALRDDGTVITWGRKKEAGMGRARTKGQVMQIILTCLIYISLILKLLRKV